MATATKQRQEFRIYRPNTKDTSKGCATAWQLSYKSDDQYNPWVPFLIAAPQTGVDDNGNASFDWKENKVTVKLGDADLGEIIAVLEGRKESAGYSGKLYHQTKNGNKIVELKSNDNGYALSISAQDADKNQVGRFYQNISHGEASLLLVLLKRAVERIYGW